MQTSASKATFLNLIMLLQATKQYNRRHDYAFRHSKGRTESTKELTNLEALAIINELEDTFKIKDQCNTMRRKIISFAHDMLWELPGGKADMNRIEKWCKESGPYKKALNKHNIKELGILVGVFEKMYKQHMDKL